MPRNANIGKDIFIIVFSITYINAHAVISKNSGNQELIAVHKCALKNTNITNPVWLSNWTKILC